LLNPKNVLAKIELVQILTFFLILELIFERSLSLVFNLAKFAAVLIKVDLHGVPLTDFLVGFERVFEVFRIKGQLVLDLLFTYDHRVWNLEIII